MNAKEFYEQMCKIQETYGENGNDDKEDCHWRMDCLMCYALEELGFQDGIKVFRNTSKWYS